MCRKAIISLSLIHEAGKLVEVLNIISSFGASILTISQNLPVNGKAHVVISLDLTDTKKRVEDIVRKISEIKGASSAKLVAVD